MSLCGCNGFQQTDIMWAVNYIKEFRESQEDDFKKALDSYMNEYFNSFMMDAVYSEDRETITLEKIDVVANATHAYDASNNSMVIGRR